MFMAALTVMLVYNVQLAFVAIMFSLLPIFVTLLLGKRLGKYEEEVSKANESYLHFLKDTLNGFSVIKSFNAESKITELLNEKNHYLEKTKEKRRIAVEQMSMIGGIAAIISQFAVFLFGAYLAIKGNAITTGVILLFLQQMNFIVKPISIVPKLISQRKSIIPLIDKLALNTTDNNVLKEKIKEISFNEFVEIKDLNYAYDNNLVLKNVNYTFLKNKSYALVGQ